MSDSEDEILAAGFEEALEWDWEDGDEVILPTCDTENPEVCESCQ